MMENRADIVVFGLRLLYFPSACFCVLYRKCMRSVNRTNAVQIGLCLFYSPLWGHGGSVTVSVRLTFFTVECNNAK